MYDIPELEKKWRKYKRNKIKKPILISLASLIIISGGLIFFKTYNYNLIKIKITQNEKRVNNNQKTQTITKNVNNSNTNINNTNNTQNNNTPSIVIQKVDKSGNPLIDAKPSQNDNQSIDLTKATIVKPNIPDDDIRVIGFDNNEKNKIKKDYSDILIPKKDSEELSIKEEIKDLEERFRETQDAQDALKIAKLYYKLKDYKKAESWAVNTNNIDGDLEDSWLIFAKAKAKQGQRVDAIKVLQTFYDETNSYKAKKLLDKLRRGQPF